MKSFKLNLLAVSALLAAGAAQAQYAAVADDKNIEIYGVLGSGIVSGSGFGMTNTGTSATTGQSFMGVSDQPHSSNRLGFRGQRKLDDSFFVKYTLESNLSLRNGTVGKDSGGYGVGNATTTSSCTSSQVTALNTTPTITCTNTASTGAFFDREANFAIGQNDMGQIQIGRGKNFLYNVLDDFDSRGNWNLGGLKPIARYAGFYSGSGYSRFDNMIRISSASYNNFRFDFAKSFGNSLATASGSTSDGKNNSTNYGVRYTDGGLDVAYTMASLKIGSEVVNEKINVTSVKYDIMPGLTGYVGIATTKNPLLTSSSSFGQSTSKVDGKTSASTTWYGAKYRVTEKTTLNAGIYSVTDRVNGGGNNVGMNSFGAQYAIGKNAEVFIDMIQSQRKGSANTAPFTIYDRWSPAAEASSSSYSESKVNQRAVSIGAQLRF